MNETLFQQWKLSGLVLAFATVLALQWLAPWARFGARGGVGRFRNVPIAVVNALVLGIACGTCICAAARWSADHRIGLFHRTTLHPLIAVLVTVPVLDLVSWAWHRAMHRVPFLWRFHRVHHSDRMLGASTALRFHFGELLLSLPLRLATVVLLGAPIEGLLLFEVIFGFFNLFEHGNLRLPLSLERLLGRIVVLPALHRLHHSIVPAELDRNFGTVFSAWDRAFGTFADADSDRPIEVGLPPGSGNAGEGFLDQLRMPLHTGNPTRSAPAP